MNETSIIVTSIDFPQIVIAIAAFWGAILSTINFLLKRKENIPKILVTLKPMEIGNYSILRITCINEGKTFISLVESGIKYSNNEKMQFSEIEHYFNSGFAGGAFPYDLFPQRKFEHDILMKKIQRDAKEKGFTGRIQILGYFVDALNREYESESQLFDIDAEYHTVGNVY